MTDTVGKLLAEREILHLATCNCELDFCQQSLQVAATKWQVAAAAAAGFVLPSKEDELISDLSSLPVMSA